MNQLHINTDEEIDLRLVLKQLLKGYKKILAGTVLAALLVGAGMAAKTYMSPAETVLSADEIAANVQTIANNQTTIDNDKAAIPNKEDEVEQWEAEASQIQASLDELNGLEAVDGESAASIVDLTAQLNTLNTQIEQGQSQITNWNNEITNLENTNADLKAKNEELQPKASTTSAAIKGAVIGAVLGFVVMCAWIAFRWILDGRLKGIDSIESRYGLPVLAEIDPKEQDNSHTYDLTTAKLELIANQNKTILLTGTVTDKNLNAITNNLNKYSKGIPFKAAPNILNTPNLILELKESETVLVITPNAKVKEVDKLVEFYILSKVSVLGVIVVGTV